MVKKTLETKMSLRDVIVTRAGRTIESQFHESVKLALTLAVVTSRRNYARWRHSKIVMVTCDIWRILSIWPSMREIKFLEIAPPGSCMRRISCTVRQLKPHFLRHEISTIFILIQIIRSSANLQLLFWWRHICKIIFLFWKHKVNVPETFFMISFRTAIKKV